MPNFRLDPFSGVRNPVTRVEFHQVRVIPEIVRTAGNVYGIYTNEGIHKAEDSPVTVHSVTSRTQTSGRTAFSEVTRTTAPSPGEYRIDYDDPDAAGVDLNTGLIECNVANNGNLLRVEYEGTGTIVRDGLALIPVGIIVSVMNHFNNSLSIAAYQSLGFALCNGTSIASQIDNPVLTGNTPNLMQSVHKDSYYLKPVHQNSSRVPAETTGVVREDRFLNHEHFTRGHVHNIYLGSDGGPNRTIRQAVHSFTSSGGNGGLMTTVNQLVGGATQQGSFNATKSDQDRTYPRNMTYLPFLKAR